MRFFLFSQRATKINYKKHTEHIRKILVNCITIYNSMLGFEWKLHTSKEKNLNNEKKLNPDEFQKGFMGKCPKCLKFHQNIYHIPTMLLNEEREC